MQRKSARNHWESLGFQTVYTHSFSLSLSLSNLSTPAPSNGTAPVKQGLNTNVSSWWIVSLPLLPANLVTFSQLLFRTHSVNIYNIKTCIHRRGELTQFEHWTTTSTQHNLHHFTSLYRSQFQLRVSANNVKKSRGKKLEWEWSKVY